MTARPTFFLSSTIYDFRDLRGAIKFALEERGCRVLASEFNDFGVDLDKHSYEACLANIEQADYFLLLIGGRVGGWFDKPNKISITQQEYRAAYQLHKQGRIRIITFVRDEIWQLKEDRNSLVRHLEKMELTDREKSEIGSYASKFANDAEFICQFVAEVGRNAETKVAVNSGGAKPTGNWIHRFRDYRDIQDVLNPLTFSGRTADEAAYAMALKRELLTILARLLFKTKDGKPNHMNGILAHQFELYPINATARLEDEFPMDAARWRYVSSIMMHLLGGRLNPMVIEDAVTSSLFMSFDRETGAFAHTPAYDALCKLVEEIRRFNQGIDGDALVMIFKFSPNAIGHHDGEIFLPTRDLMFLYSLAYRWINIVNLSASLILHLEGAPFQMPKLMPLSPIVGMEDELAKETVTPAEARVILGL